VKFENSFHVDAPIEEVWAAILDVERVAPNVPGAEVLEKTGDGAFKVGIKVKLGPITMQYRGDMEIVERDEAEHRAVMRVKAKEARGQGTADATATISLSGATDGAIATDVRLSGRAATMGRGVVQDVAGRLIDTFSNNLADSLGETKPKTETPPPPPEAPAPPPQPKPQEPPKQREDVLDVGDLAGGVVADRLKDPRLVLIAVAFVLGWVLGRRS
jgi:carbon monoxide dehydrogenase subunit G